jgi:hypothetical protein
MSKDKLIPVLNVDAFAEGYFAKCASLGVKTDEALGLYLIKRGGAWFDAAKATVTPALTGVIGYLLATGKTGAEAVSRVPQGGNDILEFIKNYGTTAALGGAGVGGLAWLMKENAKAEAAKKLTAQQSIGKAQSQQAELQRAFAPMPEEKVKPYSTVSQSDYEV